MSPALNIVLIFCLALDRPRAFSNDSACLISNASLRVAAILVSVIVLDVARRLSRNCCSPRCQRSMGRCCAAVHCCRSSGGQDDMEKGCVLVRKRLRSGVVCGVDVGGDVRAPAARVSASHRCSFASAAAGVDGPARVWVSHWCSRASSRARFRRTPCSRAGLPGFASVAW